MKDKITQEIHDAMIELERKGFSRSRIARIFQLCPQAVSFDLDGRRKSIYPQRKDEAIKVLRAALARLEAA